MTTTVTREHAETTAARIPNINISQKYVLLHLCDNITIDCVYVDNGRRLLRPFLHADFFSPT